MSQHDFNIANQSFPATRTDLNNALVALASNSSGDAEPATKYANQWWYETDTNTLKLRNQANDAWISIAVLDQSGNAVQSITTAGLTLGATAISATGAEINQLDAITRGSILYGNASGATARLVKGGAGTVLTSDGTDISWAAAAGGGGGLEFISSLDASNSDTLSFTGFDESKYDAYRFVFSNIIPVNDNVTFDARTSSNNGSSYDSGSTDYKMARFKGGSYLAYSASAYGAGVDIGSAAGEDGCSGELLVFGPHLDTKKTYLTSRSVQINNTGATISLYNTGYRDSAADVDAIQFIASSGNLESGTITMYGMVNS